MAQIAFLFAGQGAQYPGMGEGLYRSSPAAREIFDACEAIRPGTIEQCFHSNMEELSLTINTQPCLFAMDLACAAALDEAGVHASCAAGFSLGEIAAMAYCGLLSVQDAFRLVCRRAELMSRCSQEHPGAMSAILKLSEEQVRSLCEKYNGVFPVNFNCPGQTVVSGEEGQLAQLEQDVAAAKGRAMRLKVSGCFHTPHMENASKGLREFMSGLAFGQPALPLYANATAAPYTLESAEALLSRQVKSPVLWQKTIEAMLQSGVTAFVEVGAGKTLTGFMRKIAKDALACNVESPETLQEAVSQLKGENHGK